MKIERLAGGPSYQSFYLFRGFNKSRTGTIQHVQMSVLVRIGGRRGRSVSHRDEILQESIFDGDPRTMVETDHFHHQVHKVGPLQETESPLALQFTLSGKGVSMSSSGLK